MSEQLSYWVNCTCNNCFTEVSVEFPCGTLANLKGKTCTTCACTDTLVRIYPKFWQIQPNISATYPTIITLPYISTEDTPTRWVVHTPEKPPEWNISKGTP